MFIPVRKRMKTSQIFLACAAGLVATFYVWTPILREQANKQKALDNSTEESQPQPQPQSKS